MLSRRLIVVSGMVQTEAGSHFALCTGWAFPSFTSPERVRGAERTWNGTREAECPSIYGHVTRSPGLAALSYKEQFKEGDEEVDRGNDGKTTSKSGLTLNGISYYGKPRTAGSGGSWLQNLQWCPDGSARLRISYIEGR